MSTPINQPPRSNLHLPTWVVVALVIILFSSCSAASDASDAASNAREAASNSEQLLGNGGQSFTTGGDPTEVQAMCRLLGAVAVKQGLDLEKVFADGGVSGTQCQERAQQAAQP